jgi:hypothetical protein
MADDHGHEGGHGEGDHSGHGAGEEEGRVTSPMQGFAGRQAGIGAVVAAVGLVVAYAVPFLLG